MTNPIVYLNGEFMPLNEAKIPVLDRGFIFGDGVYEVIPVYGKRLFRLDEHLDRLTNNLESTRIPNPLTECEWKKNLSQIIMRNDFEDQSIYVHITRGVAKRDHAFPESISPTVFIMSSPLNATDIDTFNNGVKAITLDDVRWQYCNIKAISLLPNILLKQTAIDDGAQEAILIRDGEVTEGSASNIFIVIDGVIKTPPKSSRLLPGITRDLIVELAKQNKLDCVESNFSRAELSAADEIWLTSSTKEVLPIVNLNETPIGNGTPGPITRKMYDIFQTYKAGLKMDHDINDPEPDTLFDFPCEFPIKIMGKASNEFESEVVNIIRKHVVELEESAITRRESTKSNYTALTVTITATSRKQLDAIYMDLTACSLVNMAL